MNLTNEVRSIIDNKGLTNDSVYELLKVKLNEYKHANRERKTYNIVYTDKVSNRLQLAKEINIKGKTIASVNIKLYNIYNNGFNPKNEDVELTNQICKIMGMSYEDLVVDFPLENE